jgi:hypothetical protein
MHGMHRYNAGATARILLRDEEIRDAAIIQSLIMHEKQYYMFVHTVYLRK